MIIKFENPQFYYDLFYQLSSLIVILIFLLESFRRKIPWITMLLVVVTTRFFLIIGSRLGGITGADISYFMQHLSFPPEHSRNMAGALAFALLGMGAAKLLLKIKYPIFDVFAIAAPFGMAIQRIGCLLTGCCFGTETNLPFGIQYASNTPAFYHEFQAHRVGITDELSLHIHPVPLYIIIYSLLVGIVLLRYRDFWKRPGNLALSGIALILSGWFVIEFFRDPLSNGEFLGSMIFGLKKVQFIYLIIIPVLIATIFYRERNFVPKEYLIAPNHPVHNSLYLLMLVALLISTRNLFNLIEFNILLFVLIPVSAGIVVQMIRHLYTLQVRISVAFLVLLSFIMMSQTLPNDEKQVYQSIKLGYSTGQFVTYHNIGSGEGCDRVSQSQDFRQKYEMVGFGYSITEKQKKTTFEYGLNAYAGSHKELAMTSKIETNEQIIGVNPYVKYDTKWLGIGGGLHIGNIRYSPFDWVEEGTSKLPTTGTRFSPILPQFNIRVGPQRVIFIGYKYADQFPSPFPGLSQAFEIGSGFGQKSGFNLRVGATSGGAYFAGYIPIHNQFVLEPLYESLGGRVEGVPSQQQFSIGLHYRFGHKTKLVKPAALQ